MGKMAIIFSNQRYDETGNERRILQQIGEDQKEEEHWDDDDTTEYVLGTLAEDSLAVRGIKAYVKLGDTSNAAEVRFSYKIEEFSDTKLDISLNFESPAVVSSSSSKDEMVVQLRDFRDSK